MKIILLLTSLTLSLFVCGQKKWPVPFYFEEYQTNFEYLPDSLSIGDTIVLNTNHQLRLKLVFFSALGESYCEVYKNGKLSEKGFYISSLDTLKQYVSTRFASGNGTKKTGKRVLKYFQPLRNGTWAVYDKNRERKVEYFRGVKVS